MNTASKDCRVCAFLRSRQVSLHTRQVSLLCACNFGKDSGSATTPHLDALCGYIDASCSARAKESHLAKATLLGIKRT